MAGTKANLTQRQQEIYDFLKDKIINRGYGPTVREIGANFGIRSPNGVMCHLKALEKKGLITRESHMSRAIQLCDHSQKRTRLPLAGQIAAGS
ncbi:MAG: repressor LexA, partial [Planctomycetaceae bacterium]|nr:repressor LexA [Planctomycetaceae bacterium]